MSKFKLYYYSTRSMSFVEARWARTRLGVLSIILGALVLSTGFELNNLRGDPLGLKLLRAKKLQAENAGLRDSLSNLALRLKGFNERIASFGDEENELRLLVDLPKVDSQTRAAGFGGTDEHIRLSVASDVNKLLNELSSSLTKAEREEHLEQTMLSEAIAKYNENKAMYSHLPAIMPMEGYYSMQGFGMRYHPVYHVMRLHEGIDIANETGTPVYATGDGIVVSAGSSSTGLGTLIVINHGYGYTTVYGHLSKVLVRSGSHVLRGELIGRCGTTGVVTGPHLHYEVRLNGRLQNPVDHFFDFRDFKSAENRQAD